METLERLKFSKITVYRKLPLLAPLLSTLEFQEDSNTLTCAVNIENKKILYNKDFVELINNKDLVFVISHELLHYVFYHKCNKPEMHFVWNLCADAIINNILTDIYNYCPDYAVTYEILIRAFPQLRSYSIEELEKLSSYELASLIAKDQEFMNLMKRLANALRNKSNKQSSSSNSSTSNTSNEIKEILDEIEKKYGKEIRESIEEAIRLKEQLDSMSEKEKKELEKQIERGKMIAKQIGRESLGIEKLLEILERERKIRDWRKLLREVFSEIKSIAVDYNLQRPSIKTELLEKHYGIKTFIPAILRKGESVNVIIGIDTSGSIEDELYIEFVNEIYGLFKDLVNVQGYIVMWEEDVTKVIKISNNKHEVLEALKKRKGYGGTNIHRFLEFAKNLVRNKKNTYLIVFTDGYHETVTDIDISEFKKVIAITRDVTSWKTSKAIVLPLFSS